MRWFAFRGHALWKRPSFKNETGALRKRQVLGEKGGVCSEGRALRARDGWFPSAVSGSLTSRGVLPWTPVEHGQSSHGFPFLLFPSVQFSSVTQLCLTLCNPMDCSLEMHRSWLIAHIYLQTMNEYVTDGKTEVEGVQEFKEIKVLLRGCWNRIYLRKRAYMNFLVCFFVAFLSLLLLLWK